MTGAGQYAIILNGRLVGHTPFVFESREAAARLVRLLSEVTGAPARAVRGGWYREHAPDFSLVTVSAWLDRHGPEVMKRGHQPPDDLPDLDLHELAWPLLSCRTAARPVEASPGAACTTFPSFEELPIGAEHPSWFDGPDGSLLDILLNAHDMDDWDVRPPRHLHPHSIRMDGGWIDASDLAHLWGGRAYHQPEPDTWSNDPPPYSDWCDDESNVAESDGPGSPAPASRPPYPFTHQKEGDQDLSVRFVFLQGGQRLFGAAYEFPTEAAKDVVLSALQEILPGVTATRSFVSSGVQVFTADHFAAQLQALGVQANQLEQLTRAVASLGHHAQKAASPAHDLSREAIDLRVVQAERNRQRRQEEDQRFAQEQARAVDLQALIRAQAEAQALEREQAQAEQARLAAARIQARKAIHQQCTNRNIQHLMHFTRIENVDSILQHGLISHAHLNGRGIINDPERWDRRTQATCLSISHPNYRMFYKLRREHPNTQWAVLLLSPSIIWELHCGFTRLNAADALMARLGDEDIRGPEAFNQLFIDDAHRRQWHLATHEPTNPQAEVLCFETIAPSYIMGIQTDLPSNRPFVDVNARPIPSSLNTALFRPRHDYAAWQNQLR